MQNLNYNTICWSIEAKQGRSLSSSCLFCSALWQYAVGKYANSTRRDLFEIQNTGLTCRAYLRLNQHHLIAQIYLLLLFIALCDMGRPGRQGEGEGTVRRWGLRPFSTPSLFFVPFNTSLFTTSLTSTLFHFSLYNAGKHMPDDEGSATYFLYCKVVKKLQISKD